MDTVFEDRWTAPAGGVVRLRQIVKDLKEGKPAPSVTVRELLSWFGAYRRGYWIVSAIGNALGTVGLVTKPDFTLPWLDGEISFALPPSAEVQASTAVQPVEPQSAEIGDEAPAKVTAEAGVQGTFTDPTYRIGKLPSANQPPLSVSPDATIKEAVTLMLSQHYSQLPVMIGERGLKGILSWNSIGARLALGRTGDFVKDYMDTPAEVPADRSLFSAIPDIVEHGYVLIRATDNKVAGIVTTADLSIQFQQLAEPFLLLGEIENHVRRLMDGKFSKTELAGALDPADNGRSIEGVADLTLGGCIRLLQEPDNWAKLSIPIDRAVFTKQLDHVRLIRNDVMHFDPDPVGEEQLELLRRFTQFLQKLQQIGVS